NVPFWPFNTGDGRAMVYRIGGELCDLELTSQWAGPKYFSRAGKSTWIGVLRDPDDKPVGPFITKPDKIFGDITSDAWTTVFDDYMQSGRGPVFMDCRGASPEDLEYMVHWLRQEGNTGLLDHMAEEGIDPGKNPVEFRTYEIGLRGGVWWNVKSETSLKGLYSTGDEFGTGMTSAAIWGWIAGESAAEYIKTVEFSKPVTNKDEIDEKVGVLEDILNRRDGATWKEANIALQNIVREYCGLVRSETLLEQGLKNLGRLKKKVYETISAGNGHELGRSLEVLNLMDTAEALMLCARERKETRGRHNRADYPFTNPLLNKKLFIKKKKDKPVFEWKERGK
ncbi:MAG: FAD-dependent oxidoreductase, partial [Dehalococcoidia bacterium]|nr:FAD-dependent oxidoreductase [Dehalococcoidia bacterium]